MLCRERAWGFLRLDGSTSIGKRNKLVAQFNEPKGAGGGAAWLAGRSAVGWHTWRQQKHPHMAPRMHPRTRLHAMHKAHAHVRRLLRPRVCVFAVVQGGRLWAQPRGGQQVRDRSRLPGTTLLQAASHASSTQLL